MKKLFVRKELIIGSIVLMGLLIMTIIFSGPSIPDTRCGKISSVMYSFAKDRDTGMSIVPLLRMTSHFNFTIGSLYVRMITEAYSNPNMTPKELQLQELHRCVKEESSQHRK